MRVQDGTRGADRNTPFGQRRFNSTTAPTFKKDRMNNTALRSEHGGMEITWTPSASSFKDGPEQDTLRGKKSGKGQESRRKGVESFGAGMERGGEQEVATTEAERKGRTQRRKGIRSGSKNIFRSLGS